MKKILIATLLALFAASSIAGSFSTGVIDTTARANAATAQSTANAAIANAATAQSTANAAMPTASLPSYLASPPAIGGTTPAAGTFTTLNGINAASVVSGQFISLTTVTSTNASWTPNALTKKIVVMVCGGGGAGGGVVGTTVMGGGGQAGARAWGYTSTVSGTYAATIGAGATGVGSAVGPAGTASSFIGSGISLTASGGQGGQYFVGNASLHGQAGASGVGTGGAIKSTVGAGNSAAANSCAGGGGAYTSSASYAGGNGGSGVIYIFEFM